MRKADKVGSGGVTALTDGNYVVSSPGWNAGGGVGAGAVTWAIGSVPTSTTVSLGNSLTGSNGAGEGISLDRVGLGGVTALAGGNYVVSSPNWSNGSGVEFAAPGAATFGPALGIIGLVTSVNSAIGTQPVEVLSAAPRATGLNKILVATHESLLDSSRPTFSRP